MRFRLAHAHVPAVLSLLALSLLALTAACGGDPREPEASMAERSAILIAVPLSESMGTPARGPIPLEGVTLAEARAAGAAMLHFAFVPSSGFAYFGSDGVLTGVTVELLRDFARFAAAEHDLDLAITWWEEPRWADFYAAVRGSEGGVFGIGNVTITEARERELDFSPPYLQNIAVLVTHADVPELDDMGQIGERFRGLTALRYPGTLHEARLVALRDSGAFPDMTFEPVASNDELVGALASGPTTFGYIDIYNFWRARDSGLPLRRHPVGDDAAETFGVILPNDSDWTPVIQDFFARGAPDGAPILGSARLRGLLETHLGEELAGLLAGGRG